MKRNRNQVVLPLDLGIKIPDNDPVRKLVEICEELDYSRLYDAYLRHWRKVDPAVLFEIFVFAYMNSIYSSRAIEKACLTDIRFMWILQDESVPDHSTFARFQDEKLCDVIENLFYQLGGKLSELGELSYTNIFVDGTKIEANANRYTFVWAKAVQKNFNKLTSRIEKELPEIAVRYGLCPEAKLEQILSFLTGYARMAGIEFVSGRGKHKTQLQRDCERLLDYNERIEGYTESLNLCGTRKSYSKTDTDATFMRMKEDHMKNGQLKPGYNVQIGVESEYIVGVGLFPNPGDTTTLIPFLERIRNGSGHRHQNVIADAGYASEENYTYLQQQGQKAYIKPTDYEVRKTKKFKSNVFRTENLYYNEENDSYICPKGKRLSYVYESRKKSENGYETVKKNYVCESCAGCPARADCFQGQYENRKITISRTMIRQKQEAVERITTKEGILLRMNRSIQVEGAFGVLKQDYGFRRFLTRGKRKTETQFFLLAFAFNVQKLWSRCNSGRFNKPLFEKEIA